MRISELMNQKAFKVDGHHELPLPLNEKDIRLPSNRETAMKHLKSRKRKFNKDDQVFEECKN